LTNNDVLRRLRYTFEFNDSKMIALFALADMTVSREEISNWLKKEEDETYINCTDKQMATFLNGLIIDRRGKKDGPAPVAESSLNNNIIFRKLKIAFDLKDVDILDLMARSNFSISKHELSAFFRKADHKHFRKCKDQVLRNFLHGLQLKYRPSDDAPESSDFKWPGA
jgi:uncharacterized protein YehS (DUF1456 family)